MRTTTKFDVMIVGAGPAGTSTWLHLNKNAPALAARAVLIDRDNFPRNKLCGGAVGAWSEDVLHSLDIDLGVPSLRVDLEMRYREERWLMPGPHRVRMIRRADFDNALARTGVDRGMTFHQNERFIEARGEQGTLAVRTSRGCYRVKALVGADGALSRVRQATMRPRPRPRLATTIQVAVPVDPANDPEFDDRRMLVDFSPIDDGLQGYVWHCPFLENGKPYMHHGIGNFRVHPDRPRAEMKSLFIRELQHRHIDGRSIPWSSHPIRLFDPRAPIANARTILVGDAAGTEPLLGGGINMALTYGEIAAGALRGAFDQNDFSFQTYEENLKAHFLGGHIRDYAELAHSVYAGQTNPLDQLRTFFTDRLIRRQLRALLQGS